MSGTRLEIKVGLFVTLGLVILAILMIQFSKGRSYFRQTYALTLRASNVSGLLPRAQVLLAGVSVGHVKNIRLASNGTNVLISVDIYDEFPIHQDARFVIEQSGFLGDQYVAVIPTQNQGPLLEDGDEVECEPPFNIQEIARDARGLIQQMDQTARDLNQVIVKVRKSVLQEQTLSNLTATVETMRSASTEARTAVGNVNALVESNRAPVSLAVSNVVLFSERLNTLALSANLLVDTNAPAITKSVDNLSDSTEQLKLLLADVESGDGVAAQLLYDEELAGQVSQIASNLSVTTSNLNRRGLWGILWKQKTPRTNKPPKGALRAPRDPFD